MNWLRMDMVAFLVTTLILATSYVSSADPPALSRLTRLQPLVPFTDTRPSAHLQQGVWTPPVPSTVSNATFVIQMKNISFNAIRNSNLSYFVLDAHTARFTPAQVASLLAQNKTLLAYLSLGEAEDFRRYWQPFWTTSPPPFLVSPAADTSQYTGKYRTQFWRPQWQRIVLRFMREHVIPFGFSGLFFDGLDVYQHFTDENGHDDPAGEMIAFVRLARDQARALAPNIKIFANNVPELYESDVFRGLVDGLGVSDTWYQNDTALSTSNPQFVENVLQFTREAKRDGKVVLAVDYPTRPENVCTFYERCAAEGFLCMVTDYAMTGLTRICVRPQTTRPPTGQTSTGASFVKIPTTGYSFTSGSSVTSALWTVGNLFTCGTVIFAMAF